MAMPPELVAALQGAGGPGGPDPGGGPPPGLGGAPGGNGGPGGGAPGQAEDPDFTRLVKMAVDALKQTQDTNEDDVDKHLAMQCLEKLQGLLGTHQKQRDAALGITDVHRGVRRALRGGPGSSAGPGGAGPGY